MNIYLKVLQNKIHTLIHGEDGFALALTIALWPALVLMVSGVYVTGESIRQRIILQNAADAAAYAGALVQADSMSRIAVLNKMLAWTYVQANQMEMDYTVYNWLRKQLQRTDKNVADVTFDPSSSSFYDALAFVKSKKSICKQTGHSPRHDTEGNPEEASESISVGTDPWYYGYYAGYLDNDSKKYMSKYVLLNGTKKVSLTSDDPNDIGICPKVGLNSSTGESSSTEDSKKFADLGDTIKNAYSNVKNLNTALANIADNMSVRITAAAKETLKKNLLEFSPADTDIRITTDNVADYLKIPDNLLDKDFVSAFASSVSDAFTKYVTDSTWWVQPIEGGAYSKMLRDVDLDAEGKAKNLYLTFDWGWKIWTPDGSTGNCVCTNTQDSGTGTNTIYADTGCRVANDSRCAAQPQILQSDSYQTKGGITVSVKHEMTNPLETFLGGSGSDFDKSFFSAYSFSDDTDMWVSASAQAGVKKSGSYQYKDLVLADLQVTDWNAVMIPVTNERLKTAWMDLKPNGFGGGTSSTSYVAEDWAITSFNPEH